MTVHIAESLLPSSSDTIPSPSPSMNSECSPDTMISSTLCTSPSCPIFQPHNKGVYTYMLRKEMSREARRISSPSDPPPHVLAAYEKCLHEGMSKEDVSIWVGFHENHTEPFIEDADLRWVAPVPANQLEEYLDNGSDHMDEYLAPMKSKNGLARHPFGLTNPKDSIWAAHARLKWDKGTQKDSDVRKNDQELVQAFSAIIGLYAEGVGRPDDTVREFRIRRLTLARKLAKIRKQRR